MSDKCNQKNIYKEALDTIKMDTALKERIEVGVEQYCLDDSFKHAQKYKLNIYFRSAVAAVLVISFIVLSIYISIGFSYPVSPKSVVKHYVNAIENNDMDQALWYIEADLYENPENTLNQPIITSTSNDSTIIYNVNRYSDDGNFKWVGVRIEAGSGQSEGYKFILRKNKGRWYITSVENIND